jgi:hypothetical protein
MKKKHESLEMNFEEFYLIKVLFFEQMVLNLGIYEPAVEQFLLILETIRFDIYIVLNYDFLLGDLKKILRIKEKLSFNFQKDQLLGPLINILPPNFVKSLSSYLVDYFILRVTDGKQV